MGRDQIPSLFCRPGLTVRTLQLRLPVFPDNSPGQRLLMPPPRAAGSSRTRSDGQYDRAKAGNSEPGTRIAEGYPFPGDFRDGERRKGWQGGRPQPRDAVQEAGQETPWSVEASQIVRGPRGRAELLNSCPLADWNGRAVHRQAGYFPGGQPGAMRTLS